MYVYVPYTSLGGLYIIPNNNNLSYLINHWQSDSSFSAGCTRLNNR